MLDQKFFISRKEYYEYYLQETHQWFDIKGTMIEHYKYEDQNDSRFDTEVSEITETKEKLERIIFNQLEEFSKYVSYIKNITHEKEIKDRNTNRSIDRKHNYVLMKFVFGYCSGSYCEDTTTLEIEIDNTLVEKSEWVQNLINTVEKVSEIEGGQIKQYCDSEIIDGMLVIYNGKKAVV